MSKKSNKISTRWIPETRNDFRSFFYETYFPDPDRLGKRGSVFKYPEWLIMFIAILPVKMKIMAYVQIHKMAGKYWDVIADGLKLTPISKRQLRERLYKITYFLGKIAALIFHCFLNLSSDTIISAH